MERRAGCYGWMFRDYLVCFSVLVLFLFFPDLKNVINLR